MCGPQKNWVETAEGDQPLPPSPIEFTQSSNMDLHLERSLHG